MKASQNSRILKYLMQGKSLTPIDALSRFGTFRLSARIHDLKSDGFDIKMKLITSIDGKRFASYSLIDPYNPL